MLESTVTEVGHASGHAVESCRILGTVRLNQ